MMTASILDDQQDLYIIEPSWRHNLNQSFDSMLIYRASDIIHSARKSNHEPLIVPKSFCDYVKIDQDVDINETNSNMATSQRVNTNYTSTSKHHTRTKRDPYFRGDITESDEYSSASNRRCSLLLVADYLFYTAMGGGSTKQTTNFLIALIDRVNKIYLSTVFKDSEDDTSGN